MLESADFVTVRAFRPSFRLARIFRRLSGRLFAGLSVVGSATPGVAAAHSQERFGNGSVRCGKGYRIPWRDGGKAQPRGNKYLSYTGLLRRDDRAKLREPPI